MYFREWNEKIETRNRGAIKLLQVERQTTRTLGFHKTASIVSKVVAEFEEQAQARLWNATEYGLRCRQSLNRFAERENFIPSTEERVWNSPQTNCASSEYPTELVNERKLVTRSLAGGKKSSREIRRWYGK